MRNYLKHTLAFSILVPIGTITHELGHFLCALFYRTNVVLHFDYVTFEKNGVEAINDFSELLIWLAGPVVTLFIGLIGLIFLQSQKARYLWLGIFLTLFFSRFLFNLLAHLSFFLSGRIDRPYGGDEYYISNYLNLPSGALSLLLGIIGFAACFYTCWFKVPRKLLPKFIISALVGIPIGYLIWFVWLGPFLLP